MWCLSTEKAHARICRGLLRWQEDMPVPNLLQQLAGPTAGSELLLDGSTA